MSTSLIKPSDMFVLPAKARTSIAKRGMDLVDLRSLGIIPGIGGGARGYNAAGDILTETADGVSLNDLWRDYQDMLAEFNQQRDPLLNFLTWRTTKAREDEIGNGEQADFEEASEYGEPVGIRPGVPPTTSLGYTFKWYDLGARFTWMFLADADSQQVDAIANMAAEADNRNVFNTVMKTVFNTSRRTNKEGQTVYPFYSGQAGDLPPAVGATTFADSHQHYTGVAALTAAAYEAHLTLIREHGYTRSNGYRLVTMINDTDSNENTIRGFRTAANGGSGASLGNYDFVPAQNTDPLLLPTDVQMQGRPAATYQGMDVVGAYWESIIVKNPFIPQNYMFSFVTGGPESIQNPVAIREHPNAGLRGLRLVKGRTPDYPLIDSFYNRGFGTGIRRRGAGAVLRTNNATYAVPSAYAW